MEHLRAKGGSMEDYRRERLDKILDSFNKENIGKLEDKNEDDD